MRDSSALRNSRSSIVLDLASAPERSDFARVERSDTGGGRAKLCALTSARFRITPPRVKGVKISGVRGGSPAERAGLQGGDVIVEFAGQKIANIYDYTYALDAVKIGQPVKVVIQRDGQPQTISVIPEARK